MEPAGLVYLPNSGVTFSGAVDKSGEGQNCFVLVGYNMTINGTGSIFANDTQCAAARSRCAPQGCGPRKVGQLKRVQRQCRTSNCAWTSSRDERGVAAVEFAAVSLLLVLILGNGVDFGVYQYRTMQVQEAAQVAAQTAWKSFVVLHRCCRRHKTAPALNDALTAVDRKHLIGQSGDARS